MFTRRQAIEAGLSDKQCAHRLANGWWRQLLGAGLSAAGTPTTASRRAWAAALTWSDAVICGRTAAQLHDLRVPDDGRAHVALPRWRNPRAGFAVHVARPFGPGDIVASKNGGALRATGRTRTILDCLRLLPYDEAETLAAWVVTHGGIPQVECDRIVILAAGSHGIGQLRTLVDRIARKSASKAEDLLHDGLRAAGLDWFLPNQTIPLRGRPKVDALFAAERIVIEVDGKRYHASERFQSDRDRQNLLMAAGYTVLRFTWHDVSIRMATVVNTVRSALAQAARLA